MFARLPSLTALRLWAALLLAAIVLQAAEPVGLPLETRHGSAFSAATQDVALAPQGRAEAERRIASPLPATLPVEPAPAAVRVAPPLPAWAFRPDSTGPPAHDILARQPPPRGPPSA